MLSRLFHLRYLHNEDDFDDYSFARRYEHLNKINSNKEFRQKVDKIYLNQIKLTENKNRYALYKKSGKLWKRPDAEKIAKEMDLGCLYTYGYDYGSTHVHPMADDGEEDFYNLTGIEPKSVFPNRIVIVNNSLAIFLCLLSECLNISTFRMERNCFRYY